MPGIMDRLLLRPATGRRRAPVRRVDAAREEGLETDECDLDTGGQPDSPERLLDLGLRPLPRCAVEARDTAARADRPDVARRPTTDHVDGRPGVEARRLVRIER